MNTKKNTQKEVSNKRNTNKVKNSERVMAHELAKTNGVTYLKEGVTGKQRMKAKSDTNNAIKRERASFNNSRDAIFKEGSEWINQINMTKTAFKNKFAPRDLKNLMTLQELEWAVKAVTDEKRGYVNFTPWLLMGLIDRALKGDAVNPDAKIFFDLIESDDATAFKKHCSKIVRLRAKQLEENKKKATEDKK